LDTTAKILISLRGSSRRRSAGAAVLLAYPSELRAIEEAN